MSQHVCHWPGCGKRCPPKLWGCKSCWYKLPKYLRDKIWRHYRTGQEIDKRPSREYLDAAQEVQDWILKNHPSASFKIDKAETESLFDSVDPEVEEFNG